MVERFDLAVIGAGSAGLGAATFAARIGARVALVERSRVGGDCTWFGCVPSKTLLAEAARAQRNRDALTSDQRFAQVRSLVVETISRVAESETPELLARQGITVVPGDAAFLDSQTIQVGARRIRARRIIISTGSEPVVPEIPGLAETVFLTYREVFDLDKLPGHLLVLGGGPIGLELGQAFGRLGARVTIIERGPSLFPSADPEALALLTERLSAEGLRIITGASVRSVRQTESAVVLATDSEDITGDTFLVAVGRRPNLAGLGLERAGVVTERGAVRVNSSLQTSQPHIYAAGDTIGSFQFTHYAGWQGVIAARNALLPGSSQGLRAHVPWTIFTDPEIGQVGLTERQARQRFGRRCHVHRWPMARVDRAQTLGQIDGFIKLITTERGLLLGGTVVGAETASIINELALAIDRSLRVDDVAAAMHTYPTYGFGLQQASAEAMFKRLGSGLSGMALRLLARR